MKGNGNWDQFKEKGNIIIKMEMYTSANFKME